MKLDSFWIKIELRAWAHDNYEAFGEEYWSGDAISVRTRIGARDFQIAIAVNGFAISTPYYYPDPATFTADALAAFDSEIGSGSERDYPRALREFGESTRNKQPSPSPRSF